ncbi:MAG: NAD(P)H-dependent oxidoreductase [Nitrososphaeria archaeon]|jgi:predicted homoserine dehydrogenase-like protein
MKKDFLGKLEERKKAPISIGLIGLGQMGRGFFAQTAYVPYVKVNAICDVDLQKAIKNLESIGLNIDEISIVNNVSDAEGAIANGKIVLTDDSSIVTKIGSIEIILEATGVPSVAAYNAFSAIQNGKHIVLLTVEADVVVGRILRKMAESAGVVYTVAYGDEPGVTKELYDSVVSLGFKVIAAGKGKNNPLRFEATPEELANEAQTKKMNPRMLCSFVDGTKTAIEMTALSNATGLVPDIRGMHGPKCSWNELPKVFDLKKNGGILLRPGVVDYCRGIAPGVFVIATTEDMIIREELEYLNMGNGPNYLFYRPYHLTSLETLVSIYKAVIYGETTIVPLYKPFSETIAIAKRDLKTGEVIDGIGGFTVYGTIERHDISTQSKFVPISLTEGATVLKDISKGSPITFADVKLKDNLLLNLYRLQEALNFE